MSSKLWKASWTRLVNEAALELWKQRQNIMPCMHMHLLTERSSDESDSSSSTQEWGNESHGRWHYGNKGETWEGHRQVELEDHHSNEEQEKASSPQEMAEQRE